MTRRAATAPAREGCSHLVDVQHARCEATVPHSEMYAEMYKADFVGIVQRLGLISRWGTHLVLISVYIS